MTDDPSAGSDNIKRALLEFLERPDYEPVPQRKLIHLMHVEPEQRPRFREILRELRDSGRIVKLSRGRLAVTPPDADEIATGAPQSPRRARGTTLSGKLQRHRDGYGFVIPDSGGEDVFIAPRQLAGGLTGDRVLVQLIGRRGGGRLQGQILRTLERRSRRVFGIFEERDRGGIVRPFDPSVGPEVLILGAFRMGANDGHAAAVELLRDPVGGRPAEGKILEDLGHIDRPGTDERVVAAHHGLPLQIPAKVQAAARALPARVPIAETRRRERFDDPDPVTIDGETAKDFDDAIAVSQRPGGGFRLFVHIADVAHFVSPGDVLDEEARARGTSVYFPGRVLPMFPEKLSNDLCSLRPRVERLVQSAVLDLDATGKLTGVRFADGVIRSAARLTYTQVAAVLEGQDRVTGVPPRVVPMLKLAGRLREALESRRHARGGVDFDLPEPQILLDVEGVMTGITIEPRNEAHRLIEECMLAANEAVAGHLAGRSWDCMYRVHDEPDPLKIDALAEFAGQFGLRLPSKKGQIRLGDLGKLLEQVQGRPEHALIGMVALRSMKQARYSMENIGHFGLAAPVYCHFTSPIRRYPDLVVHRLLRACRRGKAAEVSAEKELNAVAESCSTLERKAEAAERDLLQWKKVAFIRDKVGRTYHGSVSGVTSFGLFVQLEENLVEGLVRVDSLGPEFFEFVEPRMELRGTRSGRTFRLGQRLHVRVERVDRILRRVDFALVEEEAKKDDQPSSERSAAGGRRNPSRRSGGRRRRGPRRTAGR